MGMNDEKGNIFSSAITVVAEQADVPTGNAWEAHTSPVAFRIVPNRFSAWNPRLAESAH